MLLAYLPLIQRLLLGYISKKSGEAKLSFNFFGLGLMALSVFLAFIALLFLLFSLQSFLRQIYGEPLSWLCTAAFVSVVAAITYLCAHYSKRKNGLISKLKDEVEEGAGSVQDFIEEISAPIKDHPVASVLIAAVAGMLAADKIKDKGTDA